MSRAPRKPMIVLTAAHIEQLKTPKGGYNRATMDAIAVGWPLQAGWKEGLVGRKITDGDWDLAMKRRLEEPHFYRGNTGRRV